MSKRTNQITAILSGTNNNVSTNVAIHIIFWFFIFKWFLFQAQWVTGDQNTVATYLIGLQKYLIILACFYGVSYTLRLKKNGGYIVIYVTIILFITLIVYGLSAYYLYNY